jgi:hypothetical protein
MDELTWVEFSKERMEEKPRKEWREMSQLRPEGVKQHPYNLTVRVNWPPLYLAQVAVLVLRFPGPQAWLDISASRKLMSGSAIPVPLLP